MEDNNKTIRETIISLEKIVNSVCDGSVKRYYQDSMTALPELERYLIASLNLLR